MFYIEMLQPSRVLSYVMCHMIINSFTVNFSSCQVPMEGCSYGKKEAKSARFMKILLTMYNRIKAFINNMDTFHIFKTSQKNLHVTYLKKDLHRDINS